MRVRLITVCVSLLVLAATLAAQTNSQAVRKQIEQSYAKLTQAYEHKDVGLFMQNKTPDYTVKGPSGNVFTRAEIQQLAQANMERIKKVNYLKITITDLKLNGNTAVVDSTQDFSRVVTAPNGSEHTLEMKNAKHREQWVKTTAGWQVKAMEVTNTGEEYTDGQRMDATAAK
jgi:ketosteroid isomerase-like protein